MRNTWFLRTLHFLVGVWGGEAKPRLIFDTWRRTSFKHQVLRIRNAFYRIGLRINLFLNEIERSMALIPRNATAHPVNSHHNCMRAAPSRLAVRPLIVVLRKEPAIAILPIVAAAKRTVERVLFGVAIDLVAIRPEELKCDIRNPIAAVAADRWIIGGCVEGQLIVELTIFRNRVGLYQSQCRGWLSGRGRWRCFGGSRSD